MVSILDRDATFNFPKPYPLLKRLKDILEENVDESFYLKPSQVDSIIAHCERKAAEGCGFKTNFTPPHGISKTINTLQGQRETDTFVKEPSNGCSEDE
jgi:DNA (cytosine-5)-methyltransferase 1